MHFSPSQALLLGIVMAALFLAAPASAVYDFEGIPLTVTAQGEVQGDVLTFGTYGLVAPPEELSFSLPSKPVWARVYTGVWGGTQRYTGWEEITVNNGVPVRRNLYGIDDRNNMTYVAGYGVYWIAHDCTDDLHGGKNTVSLTTSRGQSESKIDGRVYGICVVAVVEDDTGPVTNYWIAEGNEDLHGEGWSGTNPTKHDSCNITFQKIDTTATAANLSILLVASTQGQPDYVSFNGQDLGVPPADMTNYPDGALDIGDEHCYNAMGGAGTESRYVDFETFDVGSLLKENSTVRFERGRDLDGDGTITTTGSKPEGEDYIHPCCAILTERLTGTPTGPDITVDTPQVTGAYADEEASVSATIRNYGSKPAGKIPVTFSVDGTTVQTIDVDPAASGVQDVGTNITLSEGRHTIAVQAANSPEASVSIKVGTIPDLAVHIGTPVKAGTEATETQQSPLPIWAALTGVIVAALFARRPPGRKCIAVLIAGAVLVASCPLIAPPAAAAGYEDYTVPVTISNGGGSDTPSFDLTIYLDGARAAVKHIDDGVKAGETMTVDIPLYTTPGTHRLRMVADEAASIQDANREDNSEEGDYVFP